MRTLLFLLMFIPVCVYTQTFVIEQASSEAEGPWKKVHNGVVTVANQYVSVSFDDTWKMYPIRKKSKEHIDSDMRYTRIVTTEFDMGIGELGDNMYLLVIIDDTNSLYLIAEKSSY